VTEDFHSFSDKNKFFRQPKNLQKAMPHCPLRVWGHCFPAIFNALFNGTTGGAQATFFPGVCYKAVCLNTAHYRRSVQVVT